MADMRMIDANALLDKIIGQSSNTVKTKPMLGETALPL